ncbi:MAG: ATP-binding protein [Gemmatimonadaceae bacterium]|nr:ATP-binding protein [Gemmatimonadaceae bacterium]
MFLSATVGGTGREQIGTAEGALAVVTAAAARLASSPSLEQTAPDMLGAFREALGAREAGLWLDGPNGLTLHTADGDLVTDGPAVEGAIAGTGVAGLLAVPIVLAGRRLGALAVRDPRPEPDPAPFVRTLGAVLAPLIGHAQHAAELEAEVARRAREIEEERRFTEKIIDSLPVGLYVVDRDYRIRAWNRKRETGTQGVSREEAIGRTIFEILHRQPSDLLRREFEETFRTGRIQQFQMESTATGDTRTFRISKIPMRLSDAGVTHVITIGEDVTDWKEAEKRFMQGEKLAAIGQLAAGVMHEINNPLATIAACAESLQLKLDDLKQDGWPLKADHTDLLRIVDNEVHRCKRIVDGLLDFSRPKTVAKELLHVNEIVEQTLFLLKHHVRFKKLHVATHLDPELTTLVYANREQLVQVLMALLLNAVDAVADQGTIIVRTRVGRSPTEAVLVEVVDDGVGIPRSDQDKIFEPFYTTKAPGRGTGLGLSICYGIIHDHQGRIEVDSTPGRGSTFRVILPASEGV